MLCYATNEQKVQNLFKVMILYLFVKIYTEMLFYTNNVIFARQTYIVKPIFSNHCPWARMGKLPPWGSLPIDGGVGWAIIMILFVSVPVEGL